MRFRIEEEYPKEWITENEPVAPFVECERIPWPKNDPNNPHNMDGVDYFLEINSLEELLELGKRKGMNIFINIEEMAIILTESDSVD